MKRSKGPMIFVLAMLLLGVMAVGMPSVCPAQQKGEPIVIGYILSLIHISEPTRPY